MVAASLKFTQGIYTDIAGRAVDGRPGSAVTLSNGDNTDVSLWNYKLIDVPKRSGLATGTISGGFTVTSTASFTPDVPGSYRCAVFLKDAGGVQYSDTRTFRALDQHLLASPAYLAGGDENNVGGQARGWASFREDYDNAFSDMSRILILHVDGAGNVISARSPNRNVNSNGSDFTVSMPDTGTFEISWSATLELPEDFFPVVQCECVNGIFGGMGAADFNYASAIRTSATTVAVTTYDGNYVQGAYPFALFLEQV